MKCYRGRWYYQGREYTTLKAALLAAWVRIQSGGQEKAASSVTSTESGRAEIRV